MMLSPTTGFLEHVVAPAFNRMFDLPHKATTPPPVERVNERSASVSHSHSQPFQRRAHPGQALVAFLATLIPLTPPRLAQRPGGGHEPMRHRRHGLSLAAVGTPLRDDRIALPSLVVEALALRAGGEVDRVRFSRSRAKASARPLKSIWPA